MFNEFSRILYVPLIIEKISKIPKNSLNIAFREERLYTSILINDYFHMIIRG